MMRTILITTLCALQMACALRGQLFDVETRNLTATVQICMKEDAVNGTDAICFEADPSMATTVVHTLPAADAAGPLCSDGAGALTWGGCGSGASGADNSVQLSDGAGGFKSVSGFTFDSSGSLFAIPGNISSGLHQEFTIFVADSGFFGRKLLWVDSLDRAHFGIDNTSGGGGWFFHQDNAALSMPSTFIPPDATGNNFIKWFNSGVGTWEQIAAIDVADDTTLETPRGVLNFGPTITVTDELARLTAAVNMAATYIWTGGQNFDTNVNAVVTGSPTRDITNFDRVEAWGTFNGPNMEWRTNPATTGVNPYWRATAASSGNDLAWTRSGAVLAYWTGSYFGFDGDVRPITGGSFGLGNAGAPWGTAQIETATFGSSLQDGSIKWTNTVGNTHEFFIGGSGNANLFWKPPLTDTNYGLFFQEPTSAAANLIGIYTETVSGSNQRGIVSVYDESIANAAYLRPTTLQLSGTQVVTTRQAAVADVAGTAGAIYTATEQATINEIKAQLNALLARLRTHGLIAP